MVRAARAQRNHIGMAIRAFVRLEWHRVRTGIGGKLAKEGIIRRAVRSSLVHPWYTLPATAYVLTGLRHYAKCFVTHAAAPCCVAKAMTGMTSYVRSIRSTAIVSVSRISPPARPCTSRD